MDMKKRFSNRLHVRGNSKKGDTAQLAAQLAPLEELEKAGRPTQIASPHLGDAKADPHYGAIVVDNENLNLPKDMIEGRDEKTILGIEPVVLVILGVMLTFIAFIAWQISLMPAQ
jgi:hypothetical protein